MVPLSFMGKDSQMNGSWRRDVGISGPQLTHWIPERALIYSIRFLRGLSRHLSEGVFYPFALWLVF